MVDDGTNTSRVIPHSKLPWKFSGFVETELTQHSVCPHQKQCEADRHSSSQLENGAEFYGNNSTMSLVML